MIEAGRGLDPTSWEPPRVPAVYRRSSVRGLAYWLFTLGVFAAPLDSIRVGSLGGAADFALLAAGGLLIVDRLNGRAPPHLGPYIRVSLAGLILIIGGLIGTLVSGEGAGSLLNISRFAFAVCGLPLVTAAVRPSRAEVARMMSAFVLGAVVSGLASSGSINQATGRSAGLAGHPNTLGLTCAFAFCLLLGLWENANGRRRWAAVPVGAVLIFGISNSGSRTAVLELALGFGIFLALTRRFRTLVVGCLLGCLLSGALVIGVFTPAPESALGRVLYQSQGTQESDLGRRVLYDEVATRVNDHLFTGSGFGRATQAHNVYLQVVDISGLLGIVGFAALIVAVLRRPIRSRRDPLAAGGAALVIAYLVAARYANTIWDRWLWVPIVLTIAATTVPSGRAARHEERVARRAVPPRAFVA